MAKAVKNGIWVYEYDRRYPYTKYEITEVRYVLGEIFNTSVPKALICIGINPSTAVPEDLDQTLARVCKYAKEHDKEYGAWYMLNVYPQRSTDPDGMDTDSNKREDIHKRNLEEIQALIDSLKGGADVWCAWGANIIMPNRTYLKNYMHAILKLFSDAGIALKSCPPTKEGHPSHPLDSTIKGDERELQPLQYWHDKEPLNKIYNDFVKTP